MRRTHLVNASVKDGAFKEGTINAMTRQRFQTVLKPYIKHKIKGNLNHLRSKQSALSGLQGVPTMRCNFPLANAR